MSLDADLDAHPPSLHSLAWASLRRDSLCEGARNCPDATTVLCKLCGHLYQPIDIRMPEKCPKCSKLQYQRINCSTCKLVGLERLMQSNAGKLLSHIADLDAMLQCPGFAITMDEIDATEWMALRVLWDERNKYAIEERRRQEAEQRAAAAQEAARRNRG